MLSYNLDFVPRPFIPIHAHKGGCSIGLSKEEVNPICPVKKTDGSIGLDLATPYDFLLPPGECVGVELGLVWQPDPRWVDTYCLLILSRSGLAAKGVFVANAPGLIDTDYTGETDTLKVILYNSSLDHQRFNRGDRIAQVALAPLPIVSSCRFVDSPEIWNASRGGLGSTGR